MTWKALARGAEPEPSACSSLVFHQGARQYYFLERSSVGDLARPAALPSSDGSRALPAETPWGEASAGGKEPT